VELAVSWSKRFPEPIELPDGRRIETLSDARAHILELPETEQSTTKWQTAVGVLLKAADPPGNGPWIDFARICMMQALYPMGSS
jgi:hypothetical protein